ncbi:hypothetical protein EV126DRAFT_430536 [Verticillium dahliae]|nr:hypothetical protein EV126DRAFT_430536 [Verticillium dahliae]
MEVGVCGKQDEEHRKLGGPSLKLIRERDIYRPCFPIPPPSAPPESSVFHFTPFSHFEYPRHGTDTDTDTVSLDLSCVWPSSLQRLAIPTPSSPLNRSHCQLGAPRDRHTQQSQGERKADKGTEVDRPSPPAPCHPLLGSRPSAASTPVSKRTLVGRATQAPQDGLGSTTFSVDLSISRFGEKPHWRLLIGHNPLLRCTAPEGPPKAPSPRI